MHLTTLNLETARHIARPIRRLLGSSDDLTRLLSARVMPCGRGTTESETERETESETERENERSRYTWYLQKINTKRATVKVRAKVPRAEAANNDVRGSADSDLSPFSGVAAGGSRPRGVRERWRQTRVQNRMEVKRGETTRHERSGRDNKNESEREQSCGCGVMGGVLAREPARARASRGRGTRGKAAGQGEEPGCRPGWVGGAESHGAQRRSRGSGAVASGPMAAVALPQTGARGALSAVRSRHRWGVHPHVATGMRAAERGGNEHRAGVPGPAR